MFLVDSCFVFLSNPSIHLFCLLFRNNKQKDHKADKQKVVARVQRKKERTEQDRVRELREREYEMQRERERKQLEEELARTQERLKKAEVLPDWIG